MAKTAKRYLLNDGREITAQELSKEIGISIRTARCRLSQSKDVNKIFQPLSNQPNKKGKFKKYLLDDGSEWTSKELSEHLGISRQAASHRLWHSDSAEYVLHAKRPNNKESTIKVNNQVQKRMYFDPDGFWKLFNSVM